ncbi:hypothetical protein OEZ86_001709 [Tetradesmus obliquus]|nr:hypothetical protein OEZ86_001709 [Tetradesmus obliquus]
MSSDREYTDSELRLLACYKALQEIKEGKRKPSSAQQQATAGSKQAVQKDANPSTSAPLTSSTGQKLPSRIRLKATRQQDPAASGEGGAGSPSAPKSPAGAPKTPKAAVAGPSVQMAEASKPPAAAAAAGEDIDYGAVSSPEYEVDYDAVSSPEYDAA